ncbi:Alpha/Beta hydrolase fold [Rhypophila sp. PSN 637]
MKLRLENALILATALGCKASTNSTNSTGGFETIVPSANLTWTPCYDGFSCAKLQVPIDHANASVGTTFIPWMKLAGKNATAKSPSIVFIPGGPGGGGTGLLQSYKNIAGSMLGEQYNIVSFDPRGVGISDLAVDCFAGNTSARETFARLHSTGVTNLTETRTVEEQFYSSSIYGEWCNNAVATSKGKGAYGYYVTTPASVRDLLSFVEANARLVGEDPSKAKLWAYGVSYGTVVGATFASMFPDRVGRMVLDGVVNSDEYYRNNWKDNLDQMDESMEAFVTYCHSAGPEKCSFWGPSPANITARMDAAIERLQDNPVPVSGVPDKLPTLVTISDLKAGFISSVYQPLAVFPVLADVLKLLEVGGDPSVFAGFYDSQGLLNLNDATHIIRCSDVYGRNNITTLDDFKSYVEFTTKTSKYMGDLFPIWVGTVMCRGFQPDLPEGFIVEDPISEPQRNTSFPILFTTNTIDAITPPVSARKMSSRFPGSTVLYQDAIGHTVINQGGSPCYFGHVQAYFQGQMPSPSIGNRTVTCPQQYVPFIDIQPLPA